MQKIFTLLVLYSLCNFLQAQAPCQSGTNHSLDFDGLNDYVQLVNGTLTGNTDFTIEVRFVRDPNAPGTTNDRRLFSMGGYLGLNVTQFEVYERNGQLRFKWGNAPAYSPNTGTPAINDGAWHHLAAVRQGNNIKIYLDGILRFNQTVSGALNITAARLSNGWFSSSPSFMWDGQMDEVRVWNVVRSETDLNAFRNCPLLLCSQQGLRAYFKFDQGIANGSNPNITFLDDCTANNLDGTLVGPFALTGTTSNWVCSDAQFGTNCCPANFTWSVGKCSNVMFANLTPQGQPSFTYAWDFNGDNVTDSNAASPSWQFPTPGNYNVCLSVYQSGVFVCDTCKIVSVTWDTSPPIISICPPNVTLDCDDVFQVVTPQVTQSICANGLNVDGDRNDGYSVNDPYPVGTTIIVWTAEDQFGTTTCTQTVTVTDPVPPTALCQDITIQLIGTDVTVVPQMVDNGSSDDCCPNVTLSFPDYPGGLVLDCVYTCGGPQTIVLMATDCHNNTSTCTAQVTLVDGEPPIASCHSSVQIQAGYTNIGADIVDNGSYDNCSFTLTKVLSPDIAGCAEACQGPQLITLTVTDCSGNTATCTSLVTSIDTEPPTMICPSDVFSPADPGACGAVVVVDLPFTLDNCNFNLELTFTGATSGAFTSAGPLFFNVGTTVVTFTATDDCGNTATCSYLVTVIENQAPVIDCPADISISASTMACGANVFWSPPIANDNCSIPSVSSSHTSGDFFPVGVTVVTYVATDANGNTATCSFTVTVIDDNPTIVNCPPDISVTVDPGSCIASVFWQIPVVVDNCSIPSLTSTHTSGDFFPFGVTVVTYTATDNNGVATTCTFAVTVFDWESPVIIDCPLDISVTGSLSAGGANVSWAEPFSFDNCTGSTLSASHQSGDFFPCEETVVTYIAIDDFGNTATCSFRVIVDCVPPVCECAGFANTTFGPVGGVADSVICDTTVYLSCPVAGQNFEMKGDFGCVGNCQPTGLSWQLDNISTGSFITSGVTGANFTIPIVGDDIQAQGTYKLSLLGYCGQDTCRCSLWFRVPDCPKDTAVSLCGMAVVSCFSGFVANIPANGVDDANVLAIVDVRNHASATGGSNWETATDNKFMFPNWTSGNLGQIFGLDIDDNTQTIYASSTTIYGHYLPNSMPNSTFGNVYKINANNGAISTLATLPQNLSNPAGLGDVCFNSDNNHLYVTNFYDGLIYHLDATGTTLNTYDFPGNPANTFPNSPNIPGFVELGERVWAVATYKGRLYFSVWNEDRLSGRNDSQISNEIWSIALDASGDFSGTAVLEIAMPVYDPPGSDNFSFSSPVSDISFSSNGTMLVAEKATYGDVGDASSITGTSSVGNWAHYARIFKFDGNSPNNWGTGQLYYVGNYTNLASSSTKQHHANAAGGIDFGYESFDPATGSEPTLCDSMIWGTGDALRLEFPVYGWDGASIVTIPTINVYDPIRDGEGTVVITSPSPNCTSSTWTFDGTNDRVYGLTGIRTSGNSNDINDPDFVANSSIYIDMDNIYVPCQLVKTQYGDLEVFKCQSCAPDCDTACIAQSLNISTGYDPTTNSLLTPGNSDPMWTTIAVPSTSSLSSNMPANVIGRYNTSWDSPTGAQWISAAPYNNYSQNNCSAGNCTCDPIVYERCFCLCQDDSVHIEFGFWSDDAGEVLLWDDNNSTVVATFANNCDTIPGLPYNFNNHPLDAAGTYNSPPVQVDTTLFLPKGRYCLRINHWNNSSVAMGVSLEGTISGLSIEKDSCCANPNGGIVGTKYRDLDCDSIRDFNGTDWNYIDPGLGGWTFTLSGNGITATAVSDGNGQFYFPNLPPGTYTITETGQPLYEPSNPSSGSATVTVTAFGIAEVEFGNCYVCDFITPTVTQDTSGAGCCFAVKIENNKPDYFTYVSLSVLDGGSLITTGPQKPQAGSGWTLQGYSSSNALLQPTGGGTIPVGTQDVVSFCLENLTADEQTIVIEYYNLGDTVACRDTIKLKCDACVQAIVDSVYCESRNQYGVNICIKAGETLESPAGSATLVPIGGVSFSVDLPNITNSDGSVIVSLPDVQPGDTYCSIPVHISGVTGGQKVCFYAIVHDGDITAGEQDLFCCADTVPVCFILPKCDPCDSTVTYATAQDTTLGQDTCCWKITLHNPPGYYIGIGTEIITPGVSFGTVSNFPPVTGWLIASSTANNITWDPFGVQGSHVQDGWMLPVVCFEGDAPGPWEMAVTWYAADSTECYDTLSFPCVPPDTNKCVRLDDYELECIGNGDYIFNFTVTNISDDPAIVSDHLVLGQVSPSGPSRFDPITHWGTLPPGATATYSAMVHGLEGEEICFVMALHDVNDDSLHLNCCVSDTFCIMLPPCQQAQCEENIIFDGQFLDNFYDPQFQDPTDYWVAYNGTTPDFIQFDSCNSNNAVQMLGGQLTGEGVFQKVNFLAGHLYAIRLCARYVDSFPAFKPKVRLFADNGAGTSTYPASGCSSPDCELIGHTTVLGTNWANYTLNWVPDNNYNRLILTPWSSSTVTGQDVPALVRVDNICVDDHGLAPLPSRDLAVRAYPNPTSGDLTLAFDRALTASTTLRVFDMFGRVLKTERVAEGQLLHELSLNGLPVGVYFVEIEESGARLWGQRVVKE